MDLYVGNKVFGYWPCNHTSGGISAIEMVSESINHDRPIACSWIHIPDAGPRVHIQWYITTVNADSAQDHRHSRARGAGVSRLLRITLGRWKDFPHPGPRTNHPITLIKIRAHP